MILLNQKHIVMSPLGVASCVTLLIVPRTFSKKISKRHQRNLPAWSHGSGEWRIRQFRQTICRSEGFSSIFRVQLSLVNYISWLKSVYVLPMFQSHWLY